jgi:hypothetical protein
LVFDVRFLPNPHFVPHFGRWVTTGVWRVRHARRGCAFSA